MRKKIIITGGLGYVDTELCKIYSGYSWNDNIIVEDNYPYQQGDCYTPKKILSKRNYCIDKDGYKETHPYKEEDYNFLEKNIEKLPWKVLFVVSYNFANGKVSKNQIRKELFLKERKYIESGGYAP